MSSNPSTERSTNLQMLQGVHTGQVKWFNRRRGYGLLKLSSLGKDPLTKMNLLSERMYSCISLILNLKRVAIAV